MTAKEKKMRHPITLAEFADIETRSTGICAACRTEQVTEPSTQNGFCTRCGQKSVYGTEELFLAGVVQLVGGEL